MRWLLLLAVVFLSTSIPSVLRADDDSLALIDKAVKAVGGEENLKKHSAATWKETGTFHGMGQGLPYTGNYAIQLPNQFSMEIAGVFQILVDGDQGWVVTGGMTQEMTKEQLAEQKENLHASLVGNLLPLREKGFKLTRLSEDSIDGKNMNGVRVTKAGRRDVELYFDKETGLLRKLRQRVKAEELNGKEVNQEMVFEDYQERDGAKVAIKSTIQRDGKLFVESTITEYKAAGKLDNSLFAKPK